MADISTEAFKLMISDISKAREILTGVFQIELSSEERGGRVLPLTVKLAWIQGNVTNIRHDLEDSTRIIVVNDGTGDALIGGCDGAIPGGDHSGLKKGVYIGILGQILTTQPEIEIKAVKIMCLNEKPLLKTIWPDEVRDLKAFLLGRYSSWNDG